MKTHTLKTSLIILTLLFSSQVVAQENENMNTGDKKTVKIDTVTMSTVESKPTSSETPTPQEDQLITKKLKEMISKSDLLSKSNVEVSTTKGIVKIQGTVDSDSHASTLVENAESIIGVSDVDTSNLKVKDSKQPFNDTMITAKIKGLLIREKLFGEKDVAAINTSVETKNGVVYLTGVITDQAQIDNAIDIIRKKVPGVTKVEYSVKKIELTQ